MLRTTDDCGWCRNAGLKGTSDWIPSSVHVVEAADDPLSPASFRKVARPSRTLKTEKFPAPSPDLLAFPHSLRPGLTHILPPQRRGIQIAAGVQEKGDPNCRGSCGLGAQNGGVEEHAFSSVFDERQNGKSVPSTLFYINVQQTPTMSLFTLQRTSCSSYDPLSLTPAVQHYPLS